MLLCRLCYCRVIMSVISMSKIVLRVPFPYARDWTIGLVYYVYA